jgi:hypothetical protein
VRQREGPQWPPSPDPSSVSSTGTTGRRAQRTGLTAAGPTSASSPATDRVDSHLAASGRETSQTNLLHDYDEQESTGVQGKSPTAVHGASPKTRNAGQETNANISSLFGQATFFSNSVMHKSRLFGQSNMICNMSLVRRLQSRYRVTRVPGS